MTVAHAHPKMRPSVALTKADACHPTPSYLIMDEIKNPTEVAEEQKVDAAQATTTPAAETPTETVEAEAAEAEAPQAEATPVLTGTAA